MARLLQTLFLCMLLLPFSGFAQQQLQHEKKILQMPDGRIFWNAELPVFINLSPNADGTGGVPLKNTKSSKSNSDSLYFTGHGEHLIKRSTSNAYKWREEAFGIQVDGKAPLSALSLTGAPKYVSGGTTFYGKGLTGTISSADQTNMSGVDRILQSVDGVAYTDYGATLNFNTEKAVDLKYYAVDKVGNVETVRNRLFTVDLTFPEVNYTLSGDRIEPDNILSPRSKINLATTDNSSGVKKTSYQFDQSTYRSYAANVSMTGLADGEHIFYYKAIDNVENESDEKSYSFYLDRTVPVITTKIDGDQYTKSSVTYISERSKVNLTATDNKAGVKQVYYFIDGVGLTEYSAPFLVDKKQGKHRISYYGIDNVENKGAAKTDGVMNNLYLDLTSPTISKAFIGQQFKSRDTVFINADTKVRLSASDAQSGVQVVNYTLDGQGEADYAESFTVNQGGAHKIVYSSTDNVNNKKEADFYFVVDNQGPEITAIFSTKPLGTQTEAGETIPKYPPHNTIFLAASDDVVGAKTIYYSIDGGSERVYTTPIATTKKGMRELKVRVIDQVKNETLKTYKFFVE